MPPIQALLCGWYIYMTLMSGLMTLSAGPRTRIGRLASLSALVCVLLLVANFRAILPAHPIDIGPYAAVDLGHLAPHLVIVVAAVIALLRAPRQDTRLIALLLAGASLLPALLFFCRFDGGLSCRP